MYHRSMKKKRGMKMGNPFTLSFGKSPEEYISRIRQTDEIVQTFCDDTPSSQVFMLTGVRGSGKTVLMTNIASTLKKDNQWIILNLNPERDLLNAMAAKLYAQEHMHAAFVNAKIDLSLLGIGMTIEGAFPINDIEVALEKMLTIVREHRKRVLITVDEVTSNEYMRVFVSSFQIMVREDLPVLLLMTGLYENIDRLQNEKSLTFLYRAPKIALGPLDKTAVTNSFAKIFLLDIPKAKALAELTQGYPFAYQVLGYLCWEHNCAAHPEQVLDEYDQRLSEYVYGKIWSELSARDKSVVLAIAGGKTTTQEMMQATGMDKSSFSQYRNRLLKKGIVDAPERGKLVFTLPRFDHFVLLQ